MGADYYWQRAMDAAACGNRDEFLAWMLKHDDAIRSVREEVGPKDLT